MENNSCAIYTDFLSPEENAAIYAHAIAQKPLFEQSKATDKAGDGVLDPKWRNSFSLTPNHFKEHYDLLKKKVMAAVPGVMEQLNLQPFERGFFEMFLTSHNNGEFFKPHVDSSPVAQSQNRVISYVYYFHSIPREFTGGQLLFLNNKPRPLIVEPANNTIVFFDSTLLHAVHPVNCPSQQFEHGRFTLNGWLNKKAAEKVETVGM